ncbi:hypothetical protein SERLADRAFT_462239 [Serpula lacrymans var. lacrymans S7.9]|uniref:Uncharacterized protein n=1 Tax=Serpula lacrymans var. lacrymans (strain S7.9) TaxID=578457 RepID=F8NMW1_SERL9|nr:uncharacterized protein SERLADRAFT_462239 [Serpula lacrymans var. lacrymans S7.9]EGO27936.1 hypothetical protein SERLADRAFT_462239 [Serpula lacrymans var. lacrymans S7.9]
MGNMAAPNLTVLENAFCDRTHRRVGGKAVVGGSSLPPVHTLAWCAWCTVCASLYEYDGYPFRVTGASHVPSWTFTAALHLRPDETDNLEEWEMDKMDKLRDMCKKKKKS